MKEKVNDINITDEEFKRYQKVKESGQINMIRIQEVTEKVNISKEKIWYIMANYDSLIRQKATNKNENR